MKTNPLRRMLAAVVVVSAVVSVAAQSANGEDCLAGDIMYQDGQAIGVIGETCTGEASYDGSQSFCRDGQVVNEPYQGKCQGSVPYCIQCGQPGEFGAALCLSSPEVPVHCDFTGDLGAGNGSKDCLVGDIMYRHRDSVGMIGEACTGESTYDGTESFCEDGEVVRKPYSGSCGGTVPYCVQCQRPGDWGAALCLSEPSKPTHCTFNGVIPQPSKADELEGTHEGQDSGGVCPMSRWKVIAVSITSLALLLVAKQPF